MHECPPNLEFSIFGHASHVRLGWVHDSGEIRRIGIVSKTCTCREEKKDEGIDHIVGHERNFNWKHYSRQRLKRSIWLMLNQYFMNRSERTHDKMFHSCQDRFSYTLKGTDRRKRLVWEKGWVIPRAMPGMHICARFSSQFHGRGTKPHPSNSSHLYFLCLVHFSRR